MANVRMELENLMEERIVILDGAMGTMVQRYKPDEAQFRGERFFDKDKFPKDLKNNNDILCLTQPQIIEQIQLAYLVDGGADLLETNTFAATTIGQSDFFVPDPPDGERKGQAYFDQVLKNKNLRALVRDINLAACKIAHKVCDEAEAKTGQKRYIIGSIGPLQVTASLSPDVNDPGFRAVNFEQLVQTYREQTQDLIEGDVDALLVETIFDTLNAKAALFAIMEVNDEREQAGEPPLPIMISFTITDNAGRTLSGQTVEAFWNAVRHSDPMSVGINCALGADAMRPYVAELGELAGCAISVYANAGLPNPLSETGYDHTPEIMAEFMDDYAKSGFLNIVGGCCGTTPPHIAAIREAVLKHPPRKTLQVELAEA